MKKSLLLLSLLCISLSAPAQGRSPFYYNAISIEHSYLPAVVIYEYLLPDNIEYSQRISKRIYLQAGFFTENADEVPGKDFFENGFAVYAGGSMKFYLFRHAYFTPALNIYYDVYGQKNVIYDGSFTIGPTIAFEYFISNRFSLRLDVVNLNVGAGIPNGDFLGTVHRYFGVAGRYNFNFR
jgi:hypothetical protein